MDGETRRLNEKWIVESKLDDFQKHIRCPGYLIHCMPGFLSEESKRKIEAKDNESGSEGVRELINQLFSKDNWEEGTFVAFVEALRKKKYTTLADYLEEKEDGVKKSDKYYERLLRITAREIAGKIKFDKNPGILQEFKELELLNDDEFEKMRCIPSNIDKYHELVNILPRHPHWIIHFVRVLRKHNYITLIKEIEPGFEAYADKVEKPHASTGNEDASDPSKVIDECEDLLSKIDEMKQAQADENMNAQADENMNGVLLEKVSDEKTTIEFNFEDDTVDMDVEQGTNSAIDATEPFVNLQNDTSSQHEMSDEKMLNIPCEAFCETPCEANEEILQDEEMPEETSQEITEACRNLVPIVLRPNQKITAKPAIEGQNTIIIAKTGSGKTFQAMFIMKHHLDNMARVGRKRKVAFFAETYALVAQQFGQIEKHLYSYKARKLTGQSEDAQLPMRGLLEINDILVMTPQILVENMVIDEPQIDVTDFTLFVFDECHHTDKEHPYNQIMKEYLKVKFSQSSRKLPQILGLTATLGVKKAKTTIEAQKNMMQICANMDCGISIDPNVYNTGGYETPEEDTPTANSDKQEVEKRKICLDGRDPEHDPFKTKVTYVIHEIEQRMLKVEGINEVSEIPDLESRILNGCPLSKGSVQYTHWLSLLLEKVPTLDDQKIRQQLMACLRYLKNYNEGLLINNLCQVSDAIDEIKDKIPQIRVQGRKDAMDTFLQNSYRDLIRHFDSIEDIDVKFPNPFLENVKSVILQNNEKQGDDSRIMILVQTRYQSAAIKRWIEGVVELKHLRVERLVGGVDVGRDGGMTKADQKSVVEEFRKGTFKIIVCTSIGNEGIDIQGCNLVFRYSHVTNEITMVQSRGRARCLNSLYTVIGREDTIRKESINEVREQLMNRVFKEMCKMDKERFQNYIDELQKKIMVAIEMSSASKKRCIQNVDMFTIRCLDCNVFICYSGDIVRIAETNHTIFDRKFRDLYDIIENPKKKPVQIKANMQILPSGVHCKKCKTQWGSLNCYSKVTFPVLKLDGFILERNDDGRRIKEKKWSKAPFFPPEADYDTLVAAKINVF